MNRSPSRRSPHRARGVVLIVSLIMLLVLTLIAVTAVNLSQSNLKVVQNTESREHALQAAKAAIEEAISSDDFADETAIVFLSNCGAANQKCYDTDGDGDGDGDEVDVVVTLERRECINAIRVRNADLDLFGSQDDAACFLPPGEFSMCANSVWELEVAAVDAATGTEVNVRQGVSILTTTNKLSLACPSLGAGT